jgi:hypothetical protein
MLNEAIKARLGDDSAIAALVADRIYPLLTPELGALPAISYFHVDEPHEHALEGRAGLASPRIQIDAWSNDADEAWAVSQAIFNSLDSFKGLIGDVTITSSLCLSRHSFYEPATKIFHVATDFQISHHE